MPLAGELGIDSSFVYNFILGNRSMNELCRVFVHERPLPETIRLQIVKLAAQGAKQNEISRKLKVPNVYVSKILSKFQQTGSKHSVATPDIISKIQQIRSEDSSILACAIRERLLHEPFSTHDNVPSVSSINRILRKVSSASSTQSTSNYQYDTLTKPSIPSPSPASGETDGTINSSSTCSYQTSIDDKNESNSSMEEVKYKIINGDDYMINDNEKVINHNLDSKFSSKQNASRYRSSFTGKQLAELEKAFENSHYLDVDARQKLAKITKLEENRVQIWFANRRSKYRREEKRCHEKYAHIPCESSRNIQSVTSPIILSILNPDESLGYLIESNDPQINFPTGLQQNSSIHSFNCSCKSLNPTYSLSTSNCYEDLSSMQKSSSYYYHPSYNTTFSSNMIHPSSTSLQSSMP
ncbi:unnamed protein product [Rotaria socialis]|uniref:Uncharacterized protein n=1 Tax=Rotaria socialis TaxID=392032 RepID=A0A818C230_9BILA|nr:unnamed protein product [Rotaria socialis]CAF3424881.1 unnamed protein product [Rotaria socialis]CAF3702792.1 unnamed protein product [Rotaria socialis]CAF4219695.1 unnamed protein product [Rotaria socialis]CAF4431812.1 unnamed protein product [Rotaria socialis]